MRSSHTERFNCIKNCEENKYMFTLVLKVAEHSLQVHKC